MAIMLALVVGCIILSVGLWTRDLSTLRRQRSLARRIGPTASYSPTTIGDDLELNLVARIVAPIARNLINRLGDRLLPSRLNQELGRRLKMAGIEWSPASFVVLRILVTVVALAMGGVLVGLARGLTPPERVGLPIILGLVGYLFFGVRVNTKYQQRMAALDDALPEIFDILSVSVEAGLAFDGALRRVVSKTSGVVQQEFGRVLSDIQVGMTRDEALRALGNRTKSKELQRFAALVAQSDRSGSGIGIALKVQGQRLKETRIFQAREKAASLPVKMLFPVVLFIFPTLFIMVLGPGVISLIQNLTGHS